jgi:pimeloyl-ACP methyl ester carboxylesterase
MRAAHVVEIITPKKFLLNGLWFGSKRPKRVLIWIHGLASSAFSKQGIIEHLVDKETAILSFNNRGHDNVARVSNIESGKNIQAGAAYERFEDCVDDIDGAITFAKKMKAKEIYLVGHSTGCQKAVYWAHKKGNRVKGVVLLAPISDYAGMLAKYGLPKLRIMQALAKAMLKSGRSHEFVQSKFWTDGPNSPRRFLSLYTPDSVEQSIFSYFDPKKPAHILRKVQTPILAILAQKDEYGDRPAKEIVDWIEENTRTDLLSLIVKNATHGFSGHEKQVGKAIKLWILGKK